MKVLYLDCFSGISGDMAVGALCDLGLKPSTLEWELSKLEIGDFHMHFERASRHDIEGTKFSIHGGATHTHDQDEEGHEGHHHHHHGEEGECNHEHGAEGEHAHAHGDHHHHDAEDDEEEDHDHEHHHDHDDEEDDEHEHAHGHGHAHAHGEHEHGHAHEGKEEELASSAHRPQTHDQDHGEEVHHAQAHHKHEEEHGHHHHHHHHHEGCGHKHSEGRSHRQIRELIEASELSPFVKKHAAGIFQRIAVAEGKIHGMPPEDVTFHEVGALDSIADIIGFCVGVEALGVERVFVSSLHDGHGWVDCAHGRFPVPAPATLEILTGIPVGQVDEPHELITPTGAAIVAEFGASFGLMPKLAPEKIGYGIGSRKLASRPNVLRVVLGELAAE